MEPTTNELLSSVIVLLRSIEVAVWFMVGVSLVRWWWDQALKALFGS